MSKIETIPEIRALVARWLGEEPAFRYSESFAAIALCTAHAIAILGVEVLRPEGDQYQVLSFSAYETGESGRVLDSAQRANDWRTFVDRNNAYAEKYIRSEERPGEDVIYLFTDASRWPVSPD
jgi:hypothetical protein